MFGKLLASAEAASAAAPSANGIEHAYPHARRDQGGNGGSARTVRKFAISVLSALAVVTAALSAAAISAAVLGFTHAAVLIAGVTAAALATRRTARLLQLPLI